MAEIQVNLAGLDKIVNPIYYPFFRHTGRFAVLYGGSGSGKSWAIAQKIIKRIVTEDGHNILCVRKFGNTIAKSQFPLLRETIRAWGWWDQFKINEAAGKEKIVCKFNGNQIIFSGLDEVEKLKSIYNISSVWIEEANEISIEDFRELNRRLRGYKGFNVATGKRKYMQFMISFNPVSSLHWLKGHFFDKEQGVTTRIWSGYKDDADEKVKVFGSKTLTIHSTYKDNKFIDAEYAEEMEKLKEDSEYEYNVYALGLWGIVGGIYFDGAKLTARIEQVRKKMPLRVGYFEYHYNDKQMIEINEKHPLVFVDDPKGYIKVYESPLNGYPYVLGGDTAGEGSDWNVGQVINNISGSQAATLRVNFDEDLYARQMYCFGIYYNTALIGIETNFSTHPTKELERLQYPNLYVRKQSPDAFTEKLSDRYGFNTNKATRPVILGQLRTIVRESPELINDLDTLNEMTTFIINEKGKPVAADSFHDDTIMALAITYGIRDQQTFEMAAKPKDKPKGFYTRDELEDMGYSRYEIDEILDGMRPY